MNAKQLARCINRADRNIVIIADVIRAGECPVTIKMGGYKGRISHRRLKVAMQAAKSEFPASDVFVRDGGTLVTPAVAAGWQQYTSENGYWWPGLARWAAKASRMASRISHC